MLKGKTALVTGSTSGIGLGVALSLARDGANIMLNGFGEYESAKRAVAECDVKVSYHGADMGGALELDNAADGGLVAHIRLKRAPA